jgi:hypothetical protein
VVGFYKTHWHSSFFFFLDEKETKNQDETPTPIFFSHKKPRNTAEKIAVRTVSPKSAAPLLTHAVV